MTRANKGIGEGAVGGPADGEILRELPGAAERGELRAVAQGVFDLSTGELRGAEVLLRWTHPRLGAVAPDRFIPLAETGDSIHRLGAWIAGEAIGALRWWRERYPGTWLSFNVSPRQLLEEPAAAGFSSQIERQIEGLTGRTSAARSLVVELTERWRGTGCAKRDDERRLVARLGELRRLGVLIALDDFGQGDTEERHLAEPVFDLVKFAAPWAQQAAASSSGDEALRRFAQRVAIVRARGALAVAEGLETSAQRAAARRAGCSLGQGYDFGRPRPLGEWRTGARPESPPGVPARHPEEDR